MSNISEVEATDGHVRVRFSVLDRPSHITVEANRSLDHFPSFMPQEIEVRWMGTGNSDLEWAEAFAVSLQEAIQVAQHMEGMRANPDAVYGAGVESMTDEIPRLPDYLLALYVLLHGEKPYYLRSRVLTGDENEGVVDRDGMVRMALGVASRG